MMDAIERIGFALTLVFCLIAGTAAADEGESVPMETPQMNRLDDASLQRGARIFMNYCMNCHSAQYMRYNRLEDIGLTAQEIRDNLMFATVNIGDTMVPAMKKEDAKAWFGAPPPDLSVEARIRGADWLYGYLRAFYRDEKTPTGWNNLVFPNVAMPHVLWELQGTQELVETEYESEDAAEAAKVKIGDLVMIEPRHLAGPDGKERVVYAVKSLAVGTPGAMQPADYKAFVLDLVNYLQFMAEPAKSERIRVGIVVLIFLGVLFVLAYALKREYWKDVH